MNKSRRQELKKLKFKRRLKLYGYKIGDKDIYGREINLNCYKTTGKPCSCDLCSPYKYNRNKEKLNFKFELKNKI